MSITLVSPEGIETRCIGLWVNPVQNPRKIYSLPELEGHGIFDLEPEAIEFVGFSRDKYRQEWKVFKPINGYKIKGRIH